MIQPDTQSAVRPKSQSTSSNIRTNGLKHGYKNKNVIFHEICNNWVKLYKPKGKIGDQILPITTWKLILGPLYEFNYNLIFIWKKKGANAQ